jgi:hypothetical protein
MNRIALFLCFLSLTAGAQDVPDAGTTVLPERPPCPMLEEPEEEGPASEVLGAFQLSIGGERQALSGVELQGFERLSETQVLAFANPPPGPLSPEQARTLLRRLANTGLFARVTPTVRLAEGSAPMLVVTLEEQPYVTQVDIEGLHEDERDDLLEELFRVPHHLDEEEETPVGGGGLCPTGALFASTRKEALHPGFVWQGLPAALERAWEELQDEGYPLARLEATLQPEGRLVLRVDPGTVEAVEVRGVEEDLAARVREELGIRPGDPLLRSDLRRAAKRLKERLPFLVLWDVETLPEPALRIAEERGEGGVRSYRLVPGEKKPKRRSRVDLDDLEFEFSWEGFDGNHGDTEGITTEGRRVVVHMRPRGSEFKLDFLPMHTQVTGFTPGARGTLKLWDPRDRAHVTLDTALLVPLRWGGQRLPGDPEQTARQRRLHWLVGGSVQVPAIRLAEVGAQVYDFTDTADRWRIGAIDSYLYSALLNRPDSEYFRRRGYSGFATWRFAPHWLAGAEYRRDTYDSLRSFSPPFSLFRRDSRPFPNAPVDEGTMASVIGRLEYASDARPSDKVSPLFRNPEVSLLRQDWEWPDRSAVRSLLTLEVGSPELGPDSAFRFWKLVSDTVLHVSTGHSTGLRLRVRVAGGENLPRQKAEALGGWSALRGYGFKEFRGDTSLLASAEYRWGNVGAFVDVGTVHQGPSDWTDPRLGTGLLLYMGDSAQFAVAWRTDERATWVPEARLFFTRPF